MARVAFGVKAHSGWAALVALAEIEERPALVARRRLALVEASDAHWAKQPYHAAAGLDPRDAEDVVARAIAAAERYAERELREALGERSGAGDAVVACGLLLGSGMPALPVAEVLAVHARMHQAEGELFRGALARAAERCGLPLSGVREKELEALALKELSRTAPEARAQLDAAGKRAGPPWARDQKDAALCAWIALRRSGRG